jgi:two-component system invasion response regulator UvrY
MNPPTDRQVQIAVMISQGIRREEVADRLNIKRKTLDVHLYRLFKKIGARDSAHMVRLLIERGEIHVEVRQ